MATLNMDTIVSLLASEHGVPAYVEQTGGGCATIYAGTAYPDDNGDDRYQALAGPGWFEGPGWTNARAETGDFNVGPDDDGEAEPIYADDTWTEARAAQAILEVIDG